MVGYSRMIFYPRDDISSEFVVRLIPNLFILENRVAGWRPKSSAAPLLPFTRHPVFSRILVIWFRSTVSRLRSWIFSGVVVSGTRKFSVVSLVRIIACSTTFLNSLIFPGHGYLIISSIRDCWMVAMRFPMVLSNCLTNVQTRSGMSS